MLLQFIPVVQSSETLFYTVTFLSVWNDETQEYIWNVTDIGMVYNADYQKFIVNYFYF